MIELVQNAKVQMKWVGAALSYLAMTALLYIFAIVPNVGYLQTFLLGFLSYGIYDSVNYALFSKYDALIAIQDTLWGGILFTIVKYVYSTLF